MLLSNILLLSGPYLALAAPANGGNICTQLPYNLILPFANYPAAQTFCWANFPGSTKWTTTTQPPKTVWSTRTKKDCYTSTKTSKSTCPTTTPTTTTTTTTTTTPAPPPTITVPNFSIKAKKLRRNDPTSSAWHVCTSKLLASGSKVLSTACSCIETAKTGTITKPASTTVTSITTSTVFTSTTTVTVFSKRNAVC